MDALNAASVPSKFSDDEVNFTAVVAISRLIKTMVFFKNNENIFIISVDCSVA